ncbi:MAG: alkaline phosphatase D family protein [Acidobacteria bacterium]|nr:alkaline phosphatase D family protein [Acidobacteriota bacterium]
MRPGTRISFPLYPPHSGPRRAECAKEILATSQGALRGYQGAEPLGWFAVPLTRRQFLWSAAASAVALPGALEAQTASTSSPGLFRHGVASGDPLTDRVVLWTRVTPRASAPVDVRWRIATDAALEQAVASGTVPTAADRDFTVKVDAGGLQPGRRYFYAFEVGGERSPVGQTKTLPSGAVDRLRLASVCCSNYPAGYFNVYRCLANRPDLDAVVHLGDYIYEFENGVYGDGTDLLRIPEPRREAVTLSDYRIRYATYRTDPDLQEAHRLHPFIVVWDDHELANDAWSGGAANHNPEQGEGDWPTRRAAAYRAYLEWMPVRESREAGIRLYRSFRFGTLVDLLMLDTRGLRDRQVATDDLAALTSGDRTLLGGAQERWLFDQLRASRTAGTAWRVLGQQVMFSRLMPPGRPVLLADTWDGYQASRDRLFDFLEAERVRDLAILAGDLHSSWAFDVPRNPWGAYQPASGAGSLAVELVTPAISSPPLFADPVIRERAGALRAFLPHLKFLEGDSRGYVLLDITRGQLRGDWYVVPGVLERSAAERRAASFVCERGSSRLVPA